ncbi:MAG: hypothetical protein GY716_06450 [bacterium]|nr:hypothetical protein [bacterium]
MSLRSVKAAGTARVAVLGAGTPEGTQMREALAGARIPGARVDLYTSGKEEPVLGEYAGEARLIQEPDPAEILEYDAVFLCEAGALAERVIAKCSAEHTAIDTVQAAPPAAHPRLVHLDVNPEVLDDHRGLLAVPHPLALVLADLLHPLARQFGLEQATALVLRPAADFGAAGTEELQSQTVRLLNFAELPLDVFGKQLAFNVLPQQLAGAAGDAVQRRVERDVATLLGRETSPLAARLLTVPLFHGHAIQLRVALSNATDAAAVSEALQTSPNVDAGTDAPTPLDVAGETLTKLGEVADDGQGGFWIWCAAGETDSRGGRHAVQLAERVCDL